MAKFDGAGNLTCAELRYYESLRNTEHLRMFVGVLENVQLIT